MEEAKITSIKAMFKGMSKGRTMFHRGNFINMSKDQIRSILVMLMRNSSTDPDPQ